MSTFISLQKEMSFPSNFLQKKWWHAFEFSHNTQSWQHWHLIQIHQNIKRIKKKSFFLKILMYYILKISFSPKQPSVYFYWDFGRKWLLSPSFNIFDAFELDVNVVNFVYYGKTLLATYPVLLWCAWRALNAVKGG